jgi:RNA polymerase sigma factor (sigma-70 family)
MSMPAASQPTRATMFERLRVSSDAEAWRAFQETYFDLLVRYARRAGLSQVDAEDVSQGVLVAFVRAMPSFQYDRAKGRFRSYLGRCISNAVVKWKKCPVAASCSLDDLEVRTSDSVTRNGHSYEDAWEREWVAFHYRRALEAVRHRCDPKSIEVLEASVRGLSTSQTAATFGMSEEAVHKTIQRMRARLTEQIAAQVREEEDGGT